MPLPKILYTSFDQVPSHKGAATHIMAFVKRLGEVYSSPSPDHAPNVALITPSAADRPVRELVPGVIQLQLGCPEDNPLGRARIFHAKLRKVLLEQPFHVIHFRSIFEGRVACDPQLNRGAKLIYEVNGFPSIEMKYHYPQLSYEPGLIDKLRNQENKCLAAADHVIAVSKVTRNHIQNRIPNVNSISVIPNGYDPADIQGRRPQTPDQGPIRVSYFGTLAPWQGIETLLEAVELVNKERRCLLTLAGSAVRRRQQAITKMTQRLGIADCVTHHVKYDKSQICGLLHQSNMTVVPLLILDRNTDQGCSPIKLIEAMASGCPVIASNLPVVQELAVPNQHYLPARPGDARNLKNLMLQLADDPELALRLSQSARKHAAGNLTWRHATDKLISVYQSLLR